jgi:hypothetical protein
MKMESGPRRSLKLRLPSRSQKLQNAATTAHRVKKSVRILRRTERKIEDAPGDDQFGFRTAKGTK